MAYVDSLLEVTDSLAVGNATVLSDTSIDLDASNLSDPAIGSGEPMVAVFHVTAAATITAGLRLAVFHSDDPAPESSGTNVEVATSINYAAIAADALIQVPIPAGIDFAERYLGFGAVGQTAGDAVAFTVRLVPASMANMDTKTYSKAAGAKITEA
jgi:hypothetical protein